MKHLRIIFAAVLAFALAGSAFGQPIRAKGQRLLISGANGDTSYAVMPADSERATVEFISLYTDTDAPTLKFYTSGAAIPLTAAEGTAGTCSINNASIVLETNDVVVSHDSVLDTWQRHKVVVNESNSGLIVLSPAPTGSLLAGDNLYEQTADISLTLTAGYGPTPTNGVAARIPHMLFHGGGAPVYFGRPGRPVLVEFTGTTNAPTTGARIDYMTGHRE